MKLSSYFGVLGDETGEELEKAVEKARAESRERAGSNRETR